MTRFAALVDRRNVTVMFVDVVDSTLLLEQLARTHEEEFSYAILSTAIQMMAAEVRRFSGHVSKTTGDGAMAIFGAPFTLEDHAIRAVHAALSIRDRMVRYGQELQLAHGLRLQVRIGLNSGPVVMSVTDTVGSEIYDAAGSPVHLAQRIESRTPPGHVGVSARTRLLCAAAFEFERLGSFQLKGFTEPEDIYLLVRPHSPSGKRQQQGNPATSRMVGRESQRRQFLGALAALDQGHGAFLLVRGEAGCGKTRFIRECRAAIGEELVWLHGQASPYEQRRSYLPFIEILGDWLGLTASRNESDRWNVLLDKVQTLFIDDAEGIVPYLATVLGIPVPAPHAEKILHIEADVLGRQIFGSMRRLFARLAAQKPVMLVVEDFQWLDDSSARLIVHMLELCLQARFFVCVSGRSGEDSVVRLIDSTSGIRGLSAAVVEMAPLSEQQGAEVLEQLVGNDPQTRQLRDRILHKAGGNPFFIEEVVRSLIASGLLLRGAQSGAWSAASTEIAVPDTIHDVIMARVDRLDARLKQMLLTASVIGKTFLYEVLRAVAPQDQALDESLQALTERQFIEACVDLPETIFAFRHALTQEAVYRSLLSETRKHMHERVGDCLLAVFPASGSSFASAVAFHYARAEQPEKALKYLLQAAEQSGRAAASAEALRYYEEALAAYEKSKAAQWAPWQRATIECRLAEAHHHCGNTDMAHAYFLRALKACGQEMPQSRASLLLGIARQILVQAAFRLRPQREPGSDANSDPLEAIRYRVFEAYSWLLATSDQKRMGYAILRYLNIAEKLGVAEPMAKATSGCGLTLNILGLHWLARAYHARAQRWALRSGNTVTVAAVANMQGLHHAHTGRWDDAMQCFDRANALAVRSGDLNTWYTSCLHRMQVLQERGEFADVFDIGVSLVRKGRETGHDATSYLGLTVLGCAMWRLGSGGRAMLPLGMGLQRASAAGDRLSETFVEGELALCLVGKGDLDAAATHVESALSRIHRYSIRSNPAGTVLLASAELAVARLAAGKSPQSVAGARNACAQALSATRRFHFGLPRALRLMGTFHWLNGKTGQADRWWTESLAMSQQLKTSFEAALTKMEIGRCLGLATRFDEGRAIVDSLRRKAEASSSIEAAVEAIASFGVTLHERRS